MIRMIRMIKGNAHLLWVTMLLSCPALSHVANAQTPQAIVQQSVNAERAANKSDHSNWIYLEDIHKPKEHILEWVAATQQANGHRVLEKNGQKLSESQQLDLIHAFQRDAGAQRKQIAESNHDSQQVDDFLMLLPTAFRWTQTAATAVDTTLHFEPDPNFHPPTREARVFSAMAGELVIDNQQHRIRSMHGQLIHDVTFGGGILGRLKEGSTFSLEQTQVGESLWQLTAIHIHLSGNALLFKSFSLQQDDDRSHFEPAPPALTLDQAGSLLMKQPDTAPAH
jgi:hypothetical protein